MFQRKNAAKLLAVELEPDDPPIAQSSSVFFFFFTVIRFASNADLCKRSPILFSLCAAAAAALSLSVCDCGAPSSLVYAYAL